MGGHQFARLAVGTAHTDASGRRVTAAGAKDEHLMREVSRVLGHVLGGEPGQARDQLEGVIDDLRPGASTTRAMSLYALATASLQTGELESAREMIAGLLDQGEQLDDPGWRSCALSLRSMLSTGPTLARHQWDDLSSAEQALRATRSPGLRGWAASALGHALLTIGCYELAVLPLRTATQIVDDLARVPVSPTFRWSSLAEAHLRIALELEQVEHPSTRAVRADEQRAARQAASQAMRTALAPGASPRWRTRGEILAMAASRGAATVRPVAAADLLRQADSLNLEREGKIAAAMLVLSLSDQGDHAHALRAGGRAMARVSKDTAGDDLDALINWASARAASLTRTPGSDTGIRRACEAARRSRRERLATAAAVRLVQEAADQADATATDAPEPLRLSVVAGEHRAGQDDQAVEAGDGGPEDGSITLPVVWDLCERLGVQLTPREMIVLTRLCGPDRPEAIARALGLEVNTVRAHTRSIYRTLDVHSRSELVAWVVRTGCITDPARNTTLALISDPPLTRRQVEVLRAISDGMTTQQVADLLGISKGRTLQHVSAVYKKLGVHSRAQALALVRFGPRDR